jgi:aminopeptidase N
VLVLSNMPATLALDIHDGLRRTGFQPTPPMSTYLLAIAAGHMVGVSGQVRGAVMPRTVAMAPDLDAKHDARRWPRPFHVTQNLFEPHRQTCSC